MKAVKVSLQHVWLSCNGTYYCSIGFSLNNQVVKSHLQDHGLVEITKIDDSWRIGPIIDCGASGAFTNLKNLEFIVEIPEEFTYFPTSMHLQLHQELPSSDPSVSQSKSDGTRFALFGIGNIYLSFLEPWHSSLSTYNTRKSVQRMTIIGNTNIGGLPLNLGWLGIAICSVEYNVEKTLAGGLSQERDVQMHSDLIEVDHAKSTVLQRDSPKGLLQTPSKKLSKINSTTPTLFEVNERFPSVDAVQQILPKYYHLVHEPRHQPVSTKLCLPVNEIAEAATESQNNDTRPVKPSTEETSLDLDLQKKKFSSMDRHVMSVLEYQTKEIDRYRQAIRQMGELVMSLRSNISNLEMQNSQLRNDLYYGYATSHADPLSKEVLAKQMEEQKLLLQKEQNNLIIKNEYEKKYLKLLKAHQSQQSLLQEYQTKVSRLQRLEVICKNQEKIIVELESNSTQSTQPKAKLSEEVQTRAMNVCIQEGKIDRKDMPLLNRQWPSKFSFEQLDEIEERLTLLQKLEKSEGRIIALEKQMFDNARLWARERSNIKFQIAESFPGQIDFKNGSHGSHMFPSNKFGNFPAAKGEKFF